jgi:hypothetical protein
MANTGRLRRSNDQLLLSETQTGNGHLSNGWINVESMAVFICYCFSDVHLLLIAGVTLGMPCFVD